MKMSDRQIIKVSVIFTQVELHPYLPQRKLYQFCKDNRIEISAYAPLGSPGTRLPHVDTTVPGIPRLMEDPLICDIAQNHKATPAQVLLRWGIQRGYPVIVKSLNMVRMVENLGSLGIQLSDQEMEKINAIPTKYRYFHYTSACVPGQTPEEYFDGEYFN
ncbi:Aldo-keto reductase family 1 member B15 [Thelohanellus kitauei]|uniref:Aldo-keto reductase family 1 member B15 n=1 Tax=Thelohanellus kitauei TaxID=669202 RepID=A0A0C2M9E6_THEKT|nr:Aldo-keto reductase family 1 member B15 [Thelohanellus kitauei]